jgi:hypothetical protein
MDAGVEPDPSVAPPMRFASGSGLLGKALEEGGVPERAGNGVG